MAAAPLICLLFVGSSSTSYSILSSPLEAGLMEGIAAAVVESIGVLSTQVSVARLELLFQV